MLNRLYQLFGFDKLHSRATVQPVRPKLVLTVSCLDALQTCLSPKMKKRHEGIAYLLGRTDGFVTLAVSAYRPDAKTTPGSFWVGPKAMAVGVRAAARHSLQVVAQVHTHPGAAYHSEGDIEGARIRYAGYASVVLPEYGRHLPKLDGAAGFIFDSDNTWVELVESEIIIVPGECYG